MTEIPHGRPSAWTHHGCKCDVCTAARRVYRREVYLRNKAAAIARATTWKADNPEKVKASNAAYRNRNRDALRAKGLAYYERLMGEDPERVRAWRRAAAATPKGQMAGRLAAHKRRGVRPDDEAREYIAILLNDSCSYCGGPGGEIDHITPVADGGSGEWPNLTSACRRCNARKNDRPLLSFLAAA